MSFSWFSRSLASRSLYSWVIRVIAYRLRLISASISRIFSCSWASVRPASSSKGYQDRQKIKKLVNQFLVNCQNFIFSDLNCHFLLNNFTYIRCVTPDISALETWCLHWFFGRYYSKIRMSNKQRGLTFSSKVQRRLLTVSSSFYHL